MMIATVAQMSEPVRAMIPRCCQSRRWYMRILYDLTIRTVLRVWMVRWPSRLQRRVMQLRLLVTL